MGEAGQVSPELAEAYHKLYDLWWNQRATVEIDMDGYNGLSYEDTNALDEAAAVIEILLVARDGVLPPHLAPPT